MMVPATAGPRVTAAVATASATAAAAIVALGDPYRAGWFPPCPFRALTGYNCPGCGSTRAVHELMHGDVAAAFGLNPLLITVLPVVAYAYLAWVVRSFTGRQLPIPKLGAAASWTALIVMTVFAVARNLPVPALAWMAP